MRLIQNTRGVSKLILVLLLVISFLIGALLSYIYIMGFYASSEFKLPGGSIITIENVEFSEQDTSFFNVTVLNPSYSPASANIVRIAARTTDDNKVHEISDASPMLPHLLKSGVSQTFRCSWNWANYTDIRLPYTDAPVEIFVFLEDKKGAVFEVRKPYVILLISEVRFNSTVSVNYFNITVENLNSSATYVNITSISVDVANITSGMVTPSLPYGLAPGDPPAMFQILWNWTDYQGESVTVGVHTLQGYIHHRTTHLPSPVNLTITDVAFNASDTNHFNITVTNAESSPTYVDIAEISVSINNESSFNITDWTAFPSSRLEQNSSVLLFCTWNWDTFRGKNLIVIVLTRQGFLVSKFITIP